MSTTSTMANVETTMQTTTIPVETTSTTQAAPITISSTEGELRTNNYFDFMFYCSLYTLYKSPAYVYSQTGLMWLFKGRQDLVM